jgi:N4-gp56 family major capsid protein
MKYMEATLTALADRIGINSMVDQINNKATSLDSFQKELYYDTMMLEKIKIGQENYVFLKYAKTYPVPKGHKKWTIRRNFPLTEHTVPLLEGIPPKSDKMKKERIEGTYHQYGRYMEFTDRVEWKLLDPVIMEYASEYGDVATRTMHRLARKELLNTTFKNYANDKANIGELVVGDYVGLEDFRLAALKMSRLAVKPIDGVFHVITSEEHYMDLMKDPLILEYIGTNNGLSHYATGELPTLFKLKFMKTQFDEFAYGYELGNPGEYHDTSDKCRIYASTPGGNYVYANIAAGTYRTVYISAEYASQSDFTDSGDSRLHEESAITDVFGSDAVASGFEDGSPTGYNSGFAAATASANRLSDGSWIPMRAIWDFDWKQLLGGDIADPTADVEEKTAWGSFYYTYVDDTPTGGGTYTFYAKYTDADGNDAYETLGTIVSTNAGTAKGALDVSVLITELGDTLSEYAGSTFDPSALTARQLPVHTAIMLGQGALARLEAAGQGNVKMFAKEKGSAGVLDPINQRQSIGFKINAIGFELIRPEACWIFKHVPSQAPATAGISLSD